MCGTFLRARYGGGLEVVLTKSRKYFKEEVLGVFWNSLNFIELDIYIKRIEIIST